MSRSKRVKHVFAENPVGADGLPSNLAPAAKIATERDRIRTLLPGGSGSLPGDHLVNATQQLSVRDDIVQEFGEDVYDQMYRDPAIHAAIQALRVAIVANGVRALSSASSVTDPDYEARAAQADSAARMLEGLTADIYDLTVALPYRHALAEIGWSLIDDPYLKKPVWSARRLRVKNRRNYYLITDYDLDLIGVVNTATVRGFASGTESIPPDTVVPAEKLVLFVPFPLEADPRGHSLMRAAYNPWRIKSETWASYYRYLNKFAVPDIVLTAGVETSAMVPKVNYTTGAVEVDEDEKPIEETREMANYRAALNLSAGGANVMSLPPGTKAELLFAQGSGEAFTKAFEALDRQMVMSILLSARALLESLRSSKADSETAADIFDVLVTFVRLMLERCLQTSVVDRWYRYNIGEDVENAPRVALSDDSSRNLAKIGPVIAQLLGQGFFHESQFEGLDALLHAPKRDYDAWQDDLEAKKAQAEEAAKLLNPGLSGMEDGSEDGEDPTGGSNEQEDGQNEPPPKKPKR